MQVIIFPQDDNRVSIITPAPEFADQINAVAAKDVPAGKAWRIVEADALPTGEPWDTWRWTASGPLDIVEAAP